MEGDHDRECRPVSCQLRPLAAHTRVTEKGRDETTRRAQNDIFRYLAGISSLRLRVEGGVTARICRPKKGCRPCLGNHMPDPVEDPGLVRQDVVG